MVPTPEQTPSSPQGGGPSQKPAAQQRENPWLNLGFNILVPMIVLKQADDWLGVSPAVALVLALGFPVGYFCYDWFKRGKRNWISVLGFVSILLTGGIGLLKLEKEWVPIKEAAIPAIIGLVLLVSALMKKPLVRPMIMNHEVMDVERVRAVLRERGNEARVEPLMRLATYWIVASFALSTVLNFVLASWIVTAESGTDAFNDQLGNLTVVSFIVIAVPSTAILIVALLRVARGLRALTGLGYEEIFPALAEAQAKEQARRGGS
jgi:hypothetical protein